MIRNALELFDHFGVTREISLDRKIFENTEGETWIHIIPTGGRQSSYRNETWTVSFHHIMPNSYPTINSVRYESDSSGHPWIDIRDAPCYVQDFLQVPKASELFDFRGRMDITEGEFNSWVEQGKLKWLADSVHYTTYAFSVLAPIRIPFDGGITIGSVVPNSPTQPPPITLLFPFPIEQFTQAISNIDNLSDALFELADHPKRNNT